MVPLAMITDLEAAAIGDILIHQPCTAHFVRTCFRESAANRFSDSSGSVYPMMKRLEKRGLLHSVEKTEGPRQVRYYRCTPMGRRELQAWLGPPLDQDVTLTIDPLRTRVLYLNRLPKSKRQKWFTQAELLIQEKLESIQGQLQKRESGWPDSIYLSLADENAIMELRSRLKWLRQANKKLKLAGEL